MKRAIRTLARWYGRLLHLYPRAYRREYDKEMESVFGLTADDADRRGLLALLNLCLREARDLPGAIAQEHRRDARRMRRAKAARTSVRHVEGPTVGDLKEPHAAAPGPWTDGACRWAETLAGLIPFLFFGLWSIVLALLASPPPLWQLIAYVGPLVLGYGITLLGLGVGWARGFPRWSYAYVLCVPLFSLYVSIAACTTILSQAYVLCMPLLGALIPLAVMVIAVLVVTRSRPPLAPLVTTVWRDWTRLSFALYSLVPMLVWMAFDEAEDRFALPFMVALTLILAGGALAYLRSARAWQRAIALLVSTALARVVATASTALYWNEHAEPWMTGLPARWSDIVRASAASAAVLLALLAAPALLGLLRRWVGSPRAA